MQNQFNFQRLGQGQTIVDSGDQGTWQQPIQMQKQSQENTYYTGICSQANATYYTTQQPGSGNSSVSGSSTTATNFKNKGIKTARGGMGNNLCQSPYTQQAASNSQFMSNQMNIQDRSGTQMNQTHVDDTDGGYYGFPNESYMTSGGGGGNMMGMNSQGAGNMMGMISTGGGNMMGMNMMGLNSGGNVMGLNCGDGGNAGMNADGGGNVVNSGGGGNTMGMNSGGGGNMMGMNSVVGGNMGVNSGGGGNMIGINSANSSSGAVGNSMNNGNPVGMSMSGGGSMNITGGSLSSDNSVMMNNSNMGMDSGTIANQFQNHLMAAVGMGGLGSWQNNSCGNRETSYNYSSGDFARRGKRGRSFNRYRGADMFFQGNGPGASVGRHRGGGRYNFPRGGENFDSLSVNLSAANHNHWCFLRKNFNKQDNDLAEHLFDVHEKFCHHCRDRIEVKKYGKRKKSAEEPPAEPAPEEEEPEEELTEEELEMKKLMGFAGFKSTKGSRVKDNSYSTVSSVNTARAEEAEDHTTTLTEAEKRMIATVGGFSVFSKSDTSSLTTPGFGAPAVTFDPIEGSGPGYSNDPLFVKKSESKDS